MYLYRRGTVLENCSFFSAIYILKQVGTRRNHWESSTIVIWKQVSLKIQL